MSLRKKVAVGMSGGVDSSVSAYLLKEQGYDVYGLFMKNWEETNAQGICNATADYEDVLKVADQLQIPCYSVNFTEEYKESVFAEFLKDLEQGLTPNPDILCNREIKFSAFLEKALSLQMDFLATGHYCRLSETKQLLKGSDPGKDQSYFLHAVKQNALAQVLFPVGHLHKKEVRDIARKANLPTSEKKDSTGICFIGKRDFKSFVAKYLQTKPGPLQTLKGTIVGTHDGASFYTIGQRKGLAIGGEGEAWYVVGKDLNKNIVFVEQGESHPALFAPSLIASQFTWIQDPPSSYPFSCQAKIRYRQADQSCTLFSPNEKGVAQVLFETPQRAITPGQAIVFYQDDICLGGGKILM